MTLEDMLDVSQAYTRFVDAVETAYEGGYIGSEEKSILLDTVGTYVNSTVIMSMFQENEIRKILAGKVYDMFLSLVVEPMMRGEMNSNVHTLTVRVSLIRSAENLIAAALKRAWNGREREKVYGSFKVAGVMGEDESGPQSPIQVRDEEERPERK